MRKKTILQKHKDNEINNYEVNEYYKIIIVSINKEIINLVNICDRHDATPPAAQQPSLCHMCNVISLLIHLLRY